MPSLDQWICQLWIFFFPNKSNILLVSSSSIAIKVECFFLNPYWWLLIMLCLVRLSIRRRCMALSRILEKQGTDWDRSTISKVSAIFISKHGNYFTDSKLIRHNASWEGNIACLREGRCKEINRCFNHININTVHSLTVAALQRGHYIDNIIRGSRWGKETVTKRTTQIWFVVNSGVGSFSSKRRTNVSKENLLAINLG